MRKETRHGEEGAALVAVLCLLATAGVLVLSLAALSQSAEANRYKHRRTNSFCP